MPGTSPDSSARRCVVKLDPTESSNLEPRQQANVGGCERACSALAGGLLAAYGLSRGKISGTCLALAGAALVWRGLTGRCAVYQALGINTADSAAAQPQMKVTQSPVIADCSSSEDLDEESDDDVELCDQDQDSAESHVRMNVGDTVWNSAGTRRGRVVDVEELPLGSADPSEWGGVSYEVEWEDEPRNSALFVSSDDDSSSIERLVLPGPHWNCHDDPSNADDSECSEMGIIQCRARQA